MEESNAQPQATEQTTVEETTQPTIKVKFNKEEKELTYDEAVTYAQKGMNYDHVYGELQDLRNDEALKIADEIANQYGVSRVDLLKKWKADYEARAAQEYAEENGISPDVAKELLETKQLAKELQGEKKRLDDEKALKAQLNQEVEDFRKDYPDVKDEDIPEEVKALWYRGVPLTVAYEAHESKNAKARLKELEDKLNIQKTNEENAKSSMGSVKDNPSAPFKVTEEWIKNASQKEYEAHRDEVRDWYFNKRQGK